MKCEYEGCAQEAEFNFYQLNSDFTKKWVNVCDFHDKLIANENNLLKKDCPDKIFKEVKWKLKILQMKQ